MSKYFVKFAPWNEKILSSLIDKTIKFSTVFDFNDFNEYRYLSCFCTDEIFINILKKEIENFNFINNLRQLSKERGSKECQDKISAFLKNGESFHLLNSQESYHKFLEENLAYSNVGIFCVSDINVFDNDSAQLMFAHYAKNLEGMALIYEIDRKTSIHKIHDIKYNIKSEIRTSSGTTLSEWYEGNYSDSAINNFLCKSKKWEYEVEKRIFSKPGIKLASEHGIQLKAILYTSRFAGEENTLSNINKFIYNNNLIIEKIYPCESYNFCPSTPDYFFRIEKNDRKTIDFLKDPFNFPV